MEFVCLVQNACIWLPEIEHTQNHYKIAFIGIVLLPFDKFNVFHAVRWDFLLLGNVILGFLSLNVWSLFG